MSGETYFSKIQYGKEVKTTHGTPVAATRILPVSKMPAIKNDRKPDYPSEVFGVRADARRSVVHQYLYTNTIPIDHGSFQALLPILGCGMKGDITPTETTPAQGDYPWNFTPSLTGANNPDSLTMQLGDDVQAWIVEYCMFEKLKLSWKIAQTQAAAPVSISADFFGRQLTAGAFTGSLALPTQTPMNGKLSRLYVDTAWAGVGGTEVANTLREATVEIIFGNKPQFQGSANKYFNTHAEGLFAIMMTLTLQGNSAANALMTAQQAQTFQAVRLQLDGPQIGSGTSHKLTIDAGGTWEEVNQIASSDKGSNLTTATFHGFYDDTGAKQLAVNLITDRSTYSQRIGSG